MVGKMIDRVECCGCGLEVGRRIVRLGGGGTLGGFTRMRVQLAK